MPDLTTAFASARKQDMVTNTSKLVLIAIGFFVAAETASADAGSHQSTFETLTGECTKVMLMDVWADPAVCSDQVTAIRSGRWNTRVCVHHRLTRQLRAVDHILLGGQSKA